MTGRRIRFALLALLANLWTAKVVAVLMLGLAVLVAAAPEVTAGWDAAVIGGAIALTIVWAIVARVPARPAPAPAAGLALETDEEQPWLDELERIADDVGGSRPRSVSVTFGDTIDLAPGRRPELVVGLPVLFAVTAEELDALAVLVLRPTRRGRRFDDWAARLAAAWWGYAGNLTAQPSRMTFLSRRVAPLLARLLREDAERLAHDGHVADLTAAADRHGPETVASALMKARLVPHYLEHVHWPAVWGRADLEPEPPADAIDSMRAPLARLGLEPQAAEWLYAALDDPTPPARLRTQPLRNALMSLEIAPDAPDPAPIAAPDALLGERVQGLVARMTAAWQSAVADDWEGERAHGAAALAQLDLEERHGVLRPEDVLRYAELLERYRGVEAARPLYERAVDLDERNPHAAFGLGRLLLGVGDDEGLAFLERAVALDQHAAGAAGTLAAEYLERHDRHEEAVPHRARAADHAAIVEAAERERESLQSDDALIGHGLSNARCAEVEAFLRSFEEIERGYLARKAVRYFADDWPAYVLGVVRKDPGWRRRKVAHQEIVDDVFARSPLAGIAWIVTNTDGHAVERLFRGVPDTLVFRRRRTWYRRRLVWVGAVFSAFAILGALIDGSSPPRREVAASVPARIDAAAGEAISLVPRLGVADGDGIVAEHWSFGDDSTARRERAGVVKTRITHVYASPGEYAARVVVTTRAGERRGAYFAVTVSGPPA